MVCMCACGVYVCVGCDVKFLKNLHKLLGTTIYAGTTISGATPHSIIMLDK